MFNLQEKVALISGGASGIGLSCAKTLLQKGLRAVALADIAADLSATVLKEFETEFGPGKALFIHTDVSNTASYEDAFKRTIEHFKNLDIVINSAGIATTDWERELAVNLNGCINGTLLGVEKYLPKYRQGSDGVVVNISSLAGITPFNAAPIYTASKFGVVGMSLSFGDQVHYQRTKVKVLVLCPRFTKTGIMVNTAEKCLGQAYAQLYTEAVNSDFAQKIESVSDGIVKIIEEAATGTIWVSEYDLEPYEHVLAIPKRNLESF